MITVSAQPWVTQFVGDSGLMLHARAERCERYVSHAERDRYADAKTRGMCLARIFDHFDAEDHRTVRWSMIAPMVTHIAGRRS